MAMKSKKKYSLQSRFLSFNQSCFPWTQSINSMNN